MTQVNTHQPSSYTPPAQSPAVTTSRDADDTAFYLGALRRHRRLVLVLPVVAAVIVGGLNMLRRREYQASAAFLPTESSAASSALGSLSGLASQLGIPGLSSVAAGAASLGPQFYGDLLTSHALLHSLLVTRFDVKADENGSDAYAGTLMEYLKTDGKSEEDREIAARTRLSKRIIEVHVDRPTGVVRFDVKTDNRRLSAQIARRMLGLVNEFNLQRRQTQAGNERDFAARRAAAALDSLRVAEAALADFRSGNIDFSRSPRLGTRESELQRRVALAQQVYGTVSQRYELANLEAVRNTPVITIIDAPEGQVEALPRHTRMIAFFAALFGGLLACGIAIWKERAKRR
jgi:hypothetical protein